MGRTTRIYTLADGEYFVGLAALLNSLRLTGHEQELVVLDCGLGDEHRRVLRDHVTLAPLPETLARRKLLAKAYLSRLVSPEEIVVYVDSDVLVTGSLEPMIARAAAGHISVAPVDWPEKRGRSIGGWEQLFGLSAPVRRDVYVNAGFLGLSAAPWQPLLERWLALCGSIPVDAVFRGEIDENPLWAGDQDALNALLMSEVPAEAVVHLAEGAAVFPPELERVQVRDRDGLECTLDGRPVTMLHYSWIPKPWEPGSWRRMHRPLRTRTRCCCRACCSRTTSRCDSVATPCRPGFVAAPWVLPRGAVPGRRGVPAGWELGSSRASPQPRGSVSSPRADETVSAAASWLRQRDRLHRGRPPVARAMAHPPGHRAARPR